MEKIDNNLAKLIENRDKRIIKVISGAHGTCKTALLSRFQTYLLKKKVPSDHIIFIEFGNHQYSMLNDYLSVNSYIENALIGIEGKIYVFLDGISNVYLFEETLKALWKQKNIDIYLTSSTVSFANDEIGNLFKNKYIEISLYTTSFKEYYAENNKKFQTMNEAFAFYMQKGAIADSDNYLSDIYQKTIYDDIIIPKKVKQVELLEGLIQYMLQNEGQILSRKRISDALNSFVNKTNPMTIDVYLNYLLDTHLFYKVNRYDVRGHQNLLSLEKYYSVDLGLSHYLTKSNKRDTKAELENIVYFELLRRGYEVFTAKVRDVEVDFMAVKDDEIIYYQVVKSMSDATVREKTLKPLQMIHDNYEKIVLCLDRDDIKSYLGIKKINIIDFLMKE